MAEVPPKTEIRSGPLVVRTHVMPWGFLVALPLATALACLGAWALDTGLTIEANGVETQWWLFSAMLLGFALFLFLIGVGELARYLKPSVEAVVDDDGITTYGMLGARRIAWNDIVETRIDGRHLSIRARGKGAPRTLRLHFNRLAVDPARLVARIRHHRPDLKPLHGSA
ncbi:MAG: PH domain-containing protein [Hyphomicrobiaceae bacterium]